MYKHFGDQSLMKVQNVEMPHNQKVPSMEWSLTSAKYKLDLHIFPGLASYASAWCYSETPLYFFSVF